MRSRVTAAGHLLLQYGCRVAQFGRVVHALLLFLFIFLAVQLLISCTTPTRAPASSRESHPVRPLPPAQRPPFYRVRKGDTLYALSWRFGVDYRQLARWNQIRHPYRIYPGQSLRLSSPPAGSQRQARATPKREQAKTKASTATKKTKPSGSKVTPSASVPVAKRQKTPRPTRSATKPQRTQTAPAGKLSWQWPTKGKVQQSYSAADATRKGIQVTGEGGQAVVAAEAGKVVYAGSGLIGYGQLIIVKHNNKYLSAYGHNRKLLVQEGDVVTRGQPLAEMGSNGTGEPMLHFEIRKNGKPVDPLKYLPRHRL